MFVPRAVSSKAPHISSSTESPCTAVTSKEVSFNEDIVSLSKNQRWPTSGEPVCVVCGKYGEYIVDETDSDVCSLECKKQHLRQLSFTRPPTCVTIATVEEPCPSSSSIVTTTVVEPHPLTRPDDATEVGVACTREQAEFLRKQLGIMVDSEATPLPILEFSQLPLLKQLALNLKEAGFVVMTPIQMQVVPMVMSGRDLIVSSITGSGKSLSFLLPIVHRFTTTDSLLRRVLVIAPTRELCMQLEGQAKLLMKGIPEMYTALLVGGVPLAHQIHRLTNRNVKLFVATPGRLNDIIDNNAALIHSLEIDVVVLDEVDSLLEMGFENQIRSVLPKLRPSVQILMFSATIPRKTEKLSKEILKNPLRVSVGKPGAPCASIQQTILWVEEDAKKKQLFTMIEDGEIFHPPAIVFVSSRKGSLLLAEALNKVLDVSAVAIHGEMEQAKRSYIFAGIGQGKYEVIVSTGLLARGIHLDNIRQVFLFDMANTIEEFVHQVGRAGRLDSPGWAISFINNENKGVFLDLVELFTDSVSLPRQLLNSPHLETQRNRKNKKRVHTQQLTRPTGSSQAKKTNNSLLKLILENNS